MISTWRTSDFLSEEADCLAKKGDISDYFICKYQFKNCAGLISAQDNNLKIIYF